jgi:diguanylate cyclase (GGDEF)-like protein/PAS domain S-box-containing protein
MSAPFSMAGLTPHGFCLAWQPGLIWLVVGANLVIAAAYFSIPAALGMSLLRRPDFGFRRVTLLFAAFILACGATHVLDVVTLWVPVYWLSGSLDVLTAALSVATAILLWPLITKFVALPSPKALQEANRRLSEAEAVTAQANRWLSMGEQFAQVGHWRQDSAQSPMVWSHEMFRVFGLPDTGGEIADAVVRAIWHPEDRDIVRLAAASAFRDSTGFDASARAVRPSGEIRHVRVRGAIQSDRNGKAGAMFGICADRTEQAEVERALHRARSDALAANLRLEGLALQDGLTGLANRRHFDSALDGEFRRALRAGSTLAVVMIDVDHFKAFNDSYGHLAGDDCLRQIAGAIRGLLRRPGDLAARYGGEEFALILPGAESAAARDIAQRIVQAVHGLAIVHAASARGGVTISAGVASTVPSQVASDPLPLVALADRALYAAKASGRDQVCLHTPGDAPPPEIVPPVPRIEPAPERRWSRAAANVAGLGPVEGVDFAAVVEALPYGMVVTDSQRPDNPIIYANAAFSILSGHTPQEVVGRNCRLLQGPDTDRAVVAELAEAIRAGTPIRRELLNYNKNGRTFWNEINLRPLTDASGQVTGFVGTQRDLTDIRIAYAAQHDLEARLERIMENLPGYIFQRVRKPDGTYGFSYFSQSYWHILGLRDVPPIDTLDAYAHIHPVDIPHVRRAVELSVETLAEVTIEFRAVAANGKLLWLRSHSMPRHLPNGDTVWDGVGIDITAEKAAQDELAYLAYHDPLTGLFNRMRFKHLMSEAADEAAAASGRLAAFAVDLDGFQDINDALGPPVGDAVLRCVGERLALFCGADGVAGRLGGDEFTIFRPDPPSGPAILDSAAALCRDLSRPMTIQGHEITVEACVGATVYPFTERDRAGAESASDDIIKQCNMALSEAKRAGRGVARRYTVDMDDSERHRAILRRSLQRGFIEAQFRLLYHPLIDLASGRIMGAEALLRWQHPDLGLQRPDMFIPMAEASGLIVPLGAWVVSTALLQLRDWARRGHETTRISINVSSVQLRDPGFLAMIDAALRDTGADPGLVDLELTESVLIEATPALIGILDALRVRGFHLALDDFGTGYSSFRVLQDLPIDMIKIDQTFVRRVTLDTGDDAIVQAMLTVARRLGLEVIAEGIETRAQRDFIRDAGCRIGQGYFFSLPVTADEFGALLS